MRNAVTPSEMASLRFRPRFRAMYVNGTPADNPTTTDSNKNIRGLSFIKRTSALMNERIKSKKMSTILVPTTLIPNTRLALSIILRYIDKKIVHRFTSYEPRSCLD